MEPSVSDCIPTTSGFRVLRQDVTFEDVESNIGDPHDLEVAPIFASIPKHTHILSNHSDMQITLHKRLQDKLWVSFFFSLSGPDSSIPCHLICCQVNQH